MIYFLDSMKCGEAKFWINEMPNSITKPINCVADVCTTNCNNSISINRLALELSLNMDCSYYGLLGIEYIPVSNQECVEIEVHFDNNEVCLYPETIEIKDSVYTGISKEYAESLLIKLKAYMGSYNCIPPGKIIISHAAHSHVGSSEGLFGIIINILLTILSKDRIVFEQQEIADIIKQLLIFR